MPRINLRIKENYNLLNICFFINWMWSLGNSPSNTALSWNIMLSLIIESVNFTTSLISKLRCMNKDVIYVPNEIACVRPCAPLFKSIVSLWPLMMPCWVFPHQKTSKLWKTFLVFTTKCAFRTQPSCRCMDNCFCVMVESMHLGPWNISELSCDHLIPLLFPFRDLTHNSSWLKRQV